MQNVWQGPGEPWTGAIWLLVDAKQVPSKTNTDVPTKEIGNQLKGAGGSEGFRKDERKAMVGTTAEPKMGWWRGWWRVVCLDDWLEGSAHTCYRRKSTIRVKQGLRQDRTSRVGCVASLQKLKHMYQQSAVNWPNQSTLYIMMQHLRFPFIICWKTWTWWLWYHHGTCWNNQNLFLRMIREKHPGASQYLQRMTKSRITATMQE